MGIKKTEQVYEAIFNVIPFKKEVEIDEVYRKVKSLIEQEGEVISTEEPGKIELAYPMKSKKKNSKNQYDIFDTAFLATIKFTAPPKFSTAVIKEMEESSDILQSMVILSTKENTRIGEILPGEEVKVEDKQDDTSLKQEDGDIEGVDTKEADRVIPEGEKDIKVVV